MPGDFRVLLKKARKEAMIYSLQYGNEILVKELVKEIAAVVQEFTQSGGVRPFGLSLLICGTDIYGYHLYQIDPSGCYFNWLATCIVWLLHMLFATNGYVYIYIYIYICMYVCMYTFYICRFFYLNILNKVKVKTF
uniref:Uncharacterized protein n=1 Tax=Piliocolobus tephrosceles TaxID=591936 RepID=A0A8C9H277_9PRIM